MLPAASCGLASSSLLLVADGVIAGNSSIKADSFDPLLSEPGRACGPMVIGPPAMLKALIRVKSETAPFQPDDHRIQDHGEKENDGKEEQDRLQRTQEE